MLPIKLGVMIKCINITLDLLASNLNHNPEEFSSELLASNQNHDPEDLLHHLISDVSSSPMPPTSGLVTPKQKTIQKKIFY